MMDKRLEAFQRLLDVMDELREKCPWDMKQTFESLRNLTIEETYELADAISDKNTKAIEGERRRQESRETMTEGIVGKHRRKASKAL